MDREYNINNLSKQTAVLMSKFDSHEREDERRFDEIKDALKDAATNVDNVRVDLKKQSWLLTLIIGGLIALSRLPDIFHFVNQAKAGVVN